MRSTRRVQNKASDLLESASILPSPGLLHRSRSLFFLRAFFPGRLCFFWLFFFIFCFFLLGRISRFRPFYLHHPLLSPLASCWGVNRPIVCDCSIVYLPCDDLDRFLSPLRDFSVIFPRPISSQKKKISKMPPKKRKTSDSPETDGNDLTANQVSACLWGINQEDTIAFALVFLFSLFSHWFENPTAAQFHQYRLD